MEDIDSSPASPNPRKRSAPDDASPSKRPLNLRGTQFLVPTPPDTEGSSDTSPATSSNAAGDRGASPAPSSSTVLSSIESISMDPVLETNSSSATATMANTSSSGPPSAKRRKLTPAEKIQKEQEKEAKAREKAEERARRDEEKRVKDLDKQKKAEEREAKKREKELEEGRKAQEKLKKERSQMRLGAFFQTKPTTPAKSPDDRNGFLDSAGSESISVEPLDAVINQLRSSVSPHKKATPKKNQNPIQSGEKLNGSDVSSISDYHKTFLPFALPSHTFVACSGRSAVVRKPEAVLGSFEQDIASAATEAFNFEQYFPAIGRGLTLPSVRKLAERITGSQHVIDLTQDVPLETMTDVLKKVPIKHIHFHEDVRPAYCGTYTKVENAAARRAPFSLFRPDTDYTYDSEAEWEEPGEGEDIVSEDEDEADSQGDADEIDAFLDDSEDTVKNPRRMITGDLIPESTGICWANSMGRFKETNDQMHGMGIGFLIPGLEGKSINPWSTDYWSTETPGARAAVPTVNKPAGSQNDAPAPSRLPLQPRVSGNGSPPTGQIGTLDMFKGPVASVQAASGIKRGRKPAAKTLSKEDMDEFKSAIVDQDLGKLDLLKVLKARFPKMTHETIKETLGRQFAQVGTTRSEKRWVFVGNA